MRQRRALTAGALVAAVTTLLPAPPAGAAISTTAAGTILTINVTGNEQVQLGCRSGSIAINGTVPSPTRSCATVTLVRVNGDVGEQRVDARGLNGTAFVANPELEVVLAGGNDTVTDTDQADDLSMGTGFNTINLVPSGIANTVNSLGTNGAITYDGGSGDDTIDVNSSGTNGSLTVTQGGTTVVHTITGVLAWGINGNDGDDTINGTGLGTSPVTFGLEADGGAGDDTITAGSSGAFIVGGSGDNVLRGGPANDSIFSTSDTDSILTGAGSNGVTDAESLRTGRSITFDGTGTWSHRSGPEMNVFRVRPNPGGTLVTSTLGRTGQQQIAAGIAISRGLGTTSSAGSTGMADVVMSGSPVNVFSSSSLTSNRNLLDVTVPTGTWTVGGSLNNGGVIPDDPALVPVTYSQLDDLSVHGPWTNEDRGFAHRATRDLLWRFATTASLDQSQAALAGGTLTRPQFTASLMNTDEYRGIDVDRTFIEYLRRSPDSGGRTFWINSLRNGKALWRFRAQLFGSNEYFTKAGGTNSAYVARAYADVLGRAPDPSGQAFWTNKLNNGADRGQVALQFMNSAEARRRLVDDQFLRFLDRLPTTTEQTTWVDEIPTSDGELRLIAFLANSNAYYNRS